MLKNKKKIYGLIGFPVRHSLSKIMHDAAFLACGINAEYRLFEIPPNELEDFLLNFNKEVVDIEGKCIKVKDIVGFNITIPHKVKAKEILQKFQVKSLNSASNKYVDIIGAINTVKRKKDTLLYYNTDVYGFFNSLEKDLKFKITDKTQVLLMGCGGAGRAVIYSLVYNGGGCKKIYIFDINPDVFMAFEKHLKNIKEDRILKRIEFIPQNKIPQIIKKCHLLINASYVGMRDNDPVLIEKNLLHNNLAVFDLVYNKETQLIKDANSLNLPARGGAGMLLYQASYAFKIWTGRGAPIKVMRDALNKGFKNIC